MSKLCRIYTLKETKICDNIDNYDNMTVKYDKCILNLKSNVKFISNANRNYSLFITDLVKEKKFYNQN